MIYFILPHGLNFTEPFHFELVMRYLPGRSQHSVNFQWRRGKICLPEDGVSTHRDADRGILAGRGQKHKIAGLTFGKSRPCYPTFIRCQKQCRLRTTPTHLIQHKPSGTEQYICKRCTVNIYWYLLSFYCNIALFRLFLRWTLGCYIAFNSASRRDPTVFTFINLWERAGRLLLNGLLWRFKGHFNQMSSEKSSGFENLMHVSELYRNLNIVTADGFGGIWSCVSFLFWMIYVNGAEIS